MAEARQKAAAEKAAAEKAEAQRRKTAVPDSQSALADRYSDQYRDDQIILPFIKNHQGKVVPDSAVGGPGFEEVRRTFELQRLASEKKENAHLTSGKRMRVAIAALIRQELKGQQSADVQEHLRALDRLTSEANAKKVRDLLTDPKTVDQDLTWQFCPDVELVAVGLLSSTSVVTNTYLAEVLVNPLYDEQAKGYAALALGHSNAGGTVALANLVTLSSSAKSPAVKSLATWAQRQLKP